MTVGRLFLLFLCVLFNTSFQFADLGEGDNPLRFAKNLFTRLDMEGIDAAEGLQGILEVLLNNLLAVRNVLEISLPLLICAIAVSVVFAFYAWIKLLQSAFQSSFSSRRVLPQREFDPKFADFNNYA